jgi:CBS domain-containing protein
VKIAESSWHKRKRVRNKGLLVKEIMNEKHPFIYEDELATKARAIIRDLSLRILPVTDLDKKLLGKASRRDVMAISSSVSPIRVKGIMTPAKHIATVEDDSAQTIKAMLHADAWYAPVVTSNHDQTYRGVIGLENFIEPLIKTNPEKFLKDASEVMTKKIVACSPEDEIDSIWRLITVDPSVKVIKVAKVMVSKDVGRVPVKDKNGKLVGIIDREDIARTLVK